MPRDDQHRAERRIARLPVSCHDAAADRDQGEQQDEQHQIAAAGRGPGARGTG